MVVVEPARLGGQGMRVHQFEWMRKARCHGGNSYLFDNSIIRGKAGLPPTVTRDGECAIRTCMLCTVRVECLEYANRFMPDYDGIVAGIVWVDGEPVKRPRRPHDE